MEAKYGTDSKRINLQKGGVPLRLNTVISRFSDFRLSDSAFYPAHPYDVLQTPTNLCRAHAQIGSIPLLLSSLRVVLVPLEEVKSPLRGQNSSLALVRPKIQELPKPKHFLIYQFRTRTRRMHGYIQRSSDADFLNQFPHYPTFSIIRPLIGPDNRDSINSYSSNAANGTLKNQNVLPAVLTPSRSVIGDLTTLGVRSHLLPPTETKPPYSYNAALRLQCGSTHTHYYYGRTLNYVQDQHKATILNSAPCIPFITAFPQEYRLPLTF